MEVNNIGAPGGSSVLSTNGGEFSENEADMVRDLCAALWLDPGDVGL